MYQYAYLRNKKHFRRFAGYSYLFSFKEFEFSFFFLLGSCGVQPNFNFPTSSNFAEGDVIIYFLQHYAVFVVIILHVPLLCQGKNRMDVEYWISSFYIMSGSKRHPINYLPIALCVFPLFFSSYITSPLNVNSPVPLGRLLWHAYHFLSHNIIFIFKRLGNVFRLM